jgi:hypothetical protein
MVAKFRPELEAEIEAARERNNLAAVEDVVALGVADEQPDDSAAALSSVAGGHAGG